MLIFFLRVTLVVVICLVGFKLGEVLLLVTNGVTLLTFFLSCCIHIPSYSSTLNSV